MVHYLRHRHPRLNPSPVAYLLWTGGGEDGRRLRRGLSTLLTPVFQLGHYTSKRGVTVVKIFSVYASGIVSTWLAYAAWRRDIVPLLFSG